MLSHLEVGRARPSRRALAFTGSGQLRRISVGSVNNFINALSINNFINTTMLCAIPHALFGM